MVVLMEDESNSLSHIGVKRRSGRYPYGSGEDPYQHEDFYKRYLDLKNSGLTEKEISDSMGITTTKLRARRTIAYNEQLAQRQHRAYELKQKGYSSTKIGEIMGVNESTVRSLLNPSSRARANASTIIANNLKETIGKDGAVDIGKGVEQYLGYSQDKLKVAVAMLEEEGYTTHYIYTKMGGPNHTTVKVLAAPGVTVRDLVNDRNKIKNIGMSLDEPHEGGVGIKKPASLDSKRLGVVYAEDGGTERDGVMLIRPGAADLELGGSHYAQVRINVDNSHYLKGMAMYGDPDQFPDGVDIIFNTNKKRGTPIEGTGDNSVLKPLKRVTNPDGTKGDVDWSNPFGATIDPIKGQYEYDDPKTGKKKQSLVNKVNDEGDWDDWSRSLPSQMLSKQDISLAKRQLGIDLDRRKQDYDEIMALENPVVKANLLKSFSDECDSAAIHMKAAAMPRQRTQVILPIPSLKDNEIYAPNFRPGEKVILIRFPHGGKFEIPELTVNNNNKEARAALSGSKDCVGINAKVAERLSGADFDGDNVLVIPNNRGEIKTRSALEGLKNFDPKTAYPKYEGMRVMTKREKGREMGIVSNLITDMTIKGAPWEDIEKAVRHSMVVIDAEKHELNWKQSERDNQIDLLKQKWQSRGNGKYGGASTLISRSTSTERIPERKLRSAKEGGWIDPETGEKVYVETGREKVVPAKKDKDGKVVSWKKVPAESVTVKMDLAKDAYELSSGTAMEGVYANYANSLKSLANQARKSYLNSGSFKYDPQAAKTYSSEVSSLKAKLNTALKNAPLERKAELLSDNLYEAKKAAHPEYEKDDLKKLSNRCLNEARIAVGAKKQLVDITDKEWEAIQHRAVSKNALQQILQNADPDRVKQLATPKQGVAMSASLIARARSMLNRGYTQAEVADRLGVSIDTLKRNVTTKTKVADNG